MNEEINNWVKQAEHDLKMAKGIINEGGFDTCAFLCQQSVEKYLKALFILQKKQNPPKTHYLEELGRAVNCPDELLDLLKELSADYMVSRYPDVSFSAPYEEYSEEDAHKRVQIAEK